MARHKHKIRVNNWRRQGLLLAGIASVLGWAAILFLGFELSARPMSSHRPSSNSPKEVTTHSLPSKAVNYGLPVHLKIPKLTIDAPVIYLGLTKNGDMAAPASITDVGWYKNGPLPGNKGSAVLAGHLDGVGGKPGVFTSLDKLQKGDTLQIIDSNGTAISFTVKATRTYGEDAQPSEVFSSTGAARLNLITCTGAWDNAQRRYQERLVVFTEKSS